MSDIFWLTVLIDMEKEEEKENEKEKEEKEEGKDEDAGARSVDQNDIGAPPIKRPRVG